MKKEELENVREIIKRSKEGKVKLLKALEEIECLVKYIEHLELRRINQDLKSSTLKIKVFQESNGEGIPDNPLYTVTKDGFQFSLENNKKFRFIQANKEEILVETEPLCKQSPEKVGKGFRVKYEENPKSDQQV